MMNIPSVARIASLLCGLCFASLPAYGARFVDPLDAPAQLSPFAAKSFLVGVTRKPDGGWVAVGRRGHILHSTDGVAWKQAQVPVSTDLVSVFFLDAQRGWVVGHGGVILSSVDGGKQWTRQLDGRQAADLLIKHHEQLAAGPNPPADDFALSDATRFKESGPGRPFLDIWFADARRGYAIGAYNLLFVTADGGATWQPRPDLIQNENGLHLSTIAAIGNELFIAGEQGLLARRIGDGSFVRINTPYAGSFFGMTGRAGLLVLFGLEGHAYRSRDNGVVWEKLDTGITGTITAGAVLDDGRLVLAGQNGAIAVSSNGGDSFVSATPTIPTPIFAIAPATKGIVAVGSRGVRSELLQ